MVDDHDEDRPGAWTRVRQFLAEKGRREWLKRIAKKRTSPRLKRKVSPSSLADLTSMRALNANPQKENLEGFFVTVLEHVIVDQARYHLPRMDREAPLAEAEGVPEKASSADDDIRRERAAVLKEAERILPEGQLRALELRLRNREYDEIAQELGCTPREARDKCKRATAALIEARKRGRLR